MHASTLQPLVAEGLSPEVIIADFDNYKDYQIYATHPAHQEFTKRILRPLIKNRAAVQFLL